MKNGARILRCSCCRKEIRVGMGVSVVICGNCARQGIGDKLEQAKAAQPRRVKP